MMIIQKQKNRITDCFVSALVLSKEEAVNNIAMNVMRNMRNRRPFLKIFKS